MLLWYGGWYHTVGSPRENDWCLECVRERSHECQKGVPYPQKGVPYTQKGVTSEYVI